MFQTCFSWIFGVIKCFLCINLVRFIFKMIESFAFKRFGFILLKIARPVYAVDYAMLFLQHIIWIKIAFVIYHMVFVEGGRSSFACLLKCIQSSLFTLEILFGLLPFRKFRLR